MIELLQGDALTVLATLPSGSVQTVITSPPYFGLRAYSDDPREIGREATPALYVAALVAVFREVRRVLRDDGTVWLNLGDSYGRGERVKWTGDAQRGTNAHKVVTDAGGYGSTPAILPEKNLLGIPWRVAFALQDDGWILRSDIIWSKPNAMPESVRDRPTRSHEYLFLLSKSRRYYYDAHAIEEESAPSSKARAKYNGGKPSPKSIQGTAEGVYCGPPTTGRAYGQGRNKRTVWTIATRPYAGAHFATMPEALIEPCILAGSAAQACEHCGAAWGRVVERDKGEEQARQRPKHLQSARSTLSMSGGSDGWQDKGSKIRDLGFAPRCACDCTGSARSVVLDPFAGTFTVGKVAMRLQRSAIGIELNPDYAVLSDARTDGVQVELFV